MIGASKAAILNNTKPYWIFPGASIDLNFVTSQYFLKGATGPLTCSRASSGTALDSLGKLYSFASNVPRITNLGLLVEESRTNSIRNNTMQGSLTGVFGSGGSIPTNWGFSGGSTAGLTATISNINTNNNINIFDLTLSGTTTTTFITIQFDTASSIAGTYGSTYSESVFLQLVSGSLTNITGINLQFVEYNSALTQNGSNIVPTSVLSRYQSSFTSMSSTTAFIRPTLLISLNNSATVNVTFRIGLPQLELNPNVPAAVFSAVTVSNGTGGVNGTGLYTITGGTGSVSAILNCTWSAGVLTINSVNNNGTYSVLPPSPATLTYLSGTATGWTGATVTLTPYNNASQGIATSPILTSSGAVTRAADVVTLNTLPFSNPSFYFNGIPNAPLNYSFSQYGISLSDGTFNNRTVYRRSGGYPFVVGETNGSFFLNSSLSIGPWNTGLSNKGSVFFKTSSTIAAFGGSIDPTIYAGGTPINLKILNIGSDPNGQNQWNGTISRIAVASNQSLLND